MGDQLDVPLEDRDLLGEVELVASLMIAASETPGQLDQEQIDQLLGVRPTDRAPGPDPTKL